MNTMREKSFGRSIGALDAVFEFIGDYTTEFAVPPEVALALQLAVEEIFTNLIKYDSQADPAITIRLSVDESRAVAVVVNTGGTNFDMTRANRSDQPFDPAGGGGLGLLLVRKMVDEFSYDYINGTGIITIGKSLEE
jgi:serine/threonine-protein kinase RsbW